MHLVDQKQCAALCAGCGQTDLSQQVDQILLGVARVGNADDGLDVELELHPSGSDHAERLDHPKGPIDPIADTVLSAHLPQQTRCHLGEGGAEVGLRADLHHIGRRPARLGREDVELHEQDGLAHAPQAVEDPTALSATGGENLDQGAELLEVSVPAGQVRRLAAGSGGIGVVPPLHAETQHFLSPGDCPLDSSRVGLRVGQILPCTAAQGPSARSETRHRESVPSGEWLGRFWCGGG